MSIRFKTVMLSILVLALSGTLFAGGGMLDQRMTAGAQWPQDEEIRYDPWPSDGNDDGLCDDKQFNAKFAGSYYLDGTLSIPQPDGSVVVLPFFGLQTYGKDGTLIATDNGSFVNPATPQSPGHGSWVRTGEMQVTNTAYIFLFGDIFGVAGDGLCDDNSPTPLAYCLIAVPVGVVDLDPDFMTGTTTFETKLWEAGANPAFDDPLFPFPTAFGEATVTRVDMPVDPLCDDEDED